MIQRWPSFVIDSLFLAQSDPMALWSIKCSSEYDSPSPTEWIGWVLISRVDWQMLENRKACSIVSISMKMQNTLVPTPSPPPSSFPGWWGIWANVVFCSVGSDVVLYFPRHVGIGALRYLLCIPRRDILFRIRTPRNHVPSRPTTRRQTRSTRPKIPRHRLPNSRKGRSLRNPNSSPPRHSNVPPTTPITPSFRGD